MATLERLATFRTRRGRFTVRSATMIPAVMRYAAAMDDRPLTLRARGAQFTVRSTSMIPSVLRYIAALENRDGECGANAEGGGGFQPGNSCGKGEGDGGGGDNGGASATVDAPRDAEWFQKIPEPQKKAVAGWCQLDFGTIRAVQEHFTDGTFNPGPPPFYIMKSHLPQWDGKKMNLDENAVAKTLEWEKALSEAPVYSGVAYRGINPYENTRGHRPTDYTVGETIHFNSDASATSDLEVAKKFSNSQTVSEWEDYGMDPLPKKEGVILKIHTDEAADIRGFSKSEKEVVIRRKGRYTVESISGNIVTIRQKR